MRKALIVAAVLGALVLPSAVQATLPVERGQGGQVRVKFTGSDTYADTVRGPFDAPRIEGEYMYNEVLGLWVVFAYRMEFGLWCPRGLEPPDPCPPGTGYNYVTFQAVAGP